MVPSRALTPAASTLKFFPVLAKAFVSSDVSHIEVKGKCKRLFMYT